MPSHKYKKGFTLIEIMFFMTLFILFITISFSKVGSYNHVKNNIMADEAGVSLVNFINNCKYKCSIDKTGGSIYFNVRGNNLQFCLYNGQSIEEFKLPQGIKLVDLNTPGKTIYIDNRGHISNACTIKFKDSERKIHDVTICVGSAYVQFKK